MHSRRRPNKAAASPLTLHALEPRTLLSVSASLAQLIYLNTPHNVNPNAAANPLLIVPAGTVIPCDAAPLQLDLNSVPPTSYISIQNEIENGFGNGSTLTFPTTSSTVTTSGNLILTSPVLGSVLLNSGPILTFSPSPATGITVRYTIFGDANLDGTIDASDYPILNQGSGSTTLTDTVTAGNYSLLNQNFLDGSISGSTTTNSGVLSVNSDSSTDMANISAAGTLHFNAGGVILTNGTNTPTAPLSLNANGTLTLIGSNTFSPISTSGTFILANLNGDSFPTENSGTGTVVAGSSVGSTPQTLIVGNSIPNTTYSFGIINGKLTVITPSDPIPSDAFIIPTSITDNTDATTQITIPTTL